MVLTLPDLLDAATLAEIHALLAAAPWTDGFSSGTLRESG